MLIRLLLLLLPVLLLPTALRLSPSWYSGSTSLVAVAAVTPPDTAAMTATVTAALARQLREETRVAFFHAYDSYLTHAYPADELKPLSCEPRSHRNKTRGTLDDALGGYSLTLIDSLDTLLVMREFQRFNEALQLLQQDLSFDRDVTVSVFEANIRVLGGLLSAHQLSLALGRQSNLTYDGHFLLDKAVDLGNRLLPAFETSTGIPYHVVHLQRGVLVGVSKKTCPAVITYCHIMT